MIKTMYVNDLDAKLINDVLEIDKAVYPDHLQGTFDEISGRFKANRDMFILLYDENRLVGYLCLFPIKDELYDDIISNDRLFDSDISGKSMERYEPNNTYRLYVISIAIHPCYQGKGLSSQLIDGFYQYLADKKKSSIFFSAALSAAVTDGGDSLLNKIGFKKRNVLSGGYTLYELSIDDAYYASIERKLCTGDAAIVHSL
jgi:GNAT superfamily N-acetyltransferase